MNRHQSLVWAIEQAIRAPSVYNTQPWRWRIRSDVIELHADWNRHLAWADPDRRDLILSCGAALHHLRVALAARQFAVKTDRLPDEEYPGLLATITTAPGPGDVEAAMLFPAIARRHTDRRRMSRRAVPPNLLRELGVQAHREQADLVLTTNPTTRLRLLAALVEAGHRQDLAPGYPAELQLWTRRYAGSHDGVSVNALTQSSSCQLSDSTLRRFPPGNLPQPEYVLGSGAPDDAAEMLVVSTDTDTTLDWLRAGEATSAVLLAATALHLATTPLSQGIEIEQSRREIMQDVLHTSQYPQMILRVGWPATESTELTGTDRRALSSVLLRH